MIQFMKYSWMYAVISFTVLAIGVGTLVTKGIPLSIDFTGGSVVSYAFEKSVPEARVKEAFTKEKIKIVTLSQENGIKYTIRTEPMDEKTEQKLRTDLKADLLVFESVGPSLGAETLRKTSIAAAIAVLGILIYITFTFQRFNYGLAAIVALLHDVAILIGMYALLAYFGAEVDALFITALLTVMSFSVHDTIVVFDKIREYRRTSGLPIGQLADRALTETMVRSVNNSLTIILMLVPLVWMGGDSLKFFAAALLIGTITGTYSSPFVATPLLVYFETRKK